jgi:hypothetical protein
VVRFEGPKERGPEAECKPVRCGLDGTETGKKGLINGYKLVEQISFFSCTRDITVSGDANPRVAIE